jgi:hypothetical protein
VADGVMIVLGAALVTVPIVDAVITWASDQVLVSPRDLERWAGIVLMPGWTWLLVSSFLFHGFRQENYRVEWGPRLPRVVASILGLLAAVCVAVIGCGLMIGAAKGAVRTVGGGYEVATGSLNHGAWTPVGRSAYESWQARFLRLDSAFSLFGLLMLGTGIRFVWLRRSFKESGVGARCWR